MFGSMMFMTHSSLILSGGLFLSEIAVENERWQVLYLLYHS
jgi:hypothetical protein